MGYIQGLLALFQVIKSVIDGAKALAAFIEKNRNEAWFQESSRVFQALETAKTEEESKNAFKDYLRLIGKL